MWHTCSQCLGEEIAGTRSAYSRGERDVQSVFYFSAGAASLLWHCGWHWPTSHRVWSESFGSGSNNLTQNYTCLHSAPNITNARIPVTRAYKNYCTIEWASWLSSKFSFLSIMFFSPSHEHVTMMPGFPLFDDKTTTYLPPNISYSYMFIMVILLISAQVCRRMITGTFRSVGQCSTLVSS